MKAIQGRWANIFFQLTKERKEKKRKIKPNEQRKRKYV
jgi:hypothetical protein